MTYPANSSTVGYIKPQTPNPPPFGKLSFEQFLQTVFVGVSGLPGDLVRPKWQVNPPAQPDILVDWLAIGLAEDDADTFTYSGVDDNGNNQFMRMEALAVQCTFYGPNSLDYMRIVRDGLQLGQNREALQKALMDFVNTSKGMRVPDLVNERWVNRWEMTAYFRRQDMRVYPILDFVSGSGSVIINNPGKGTITESVSIDSEEG
jgi:hypothetical protein